MAVDNGDVGQVLRNWREAERNHVDDAEWLVPVGDLAVPCPVVRQSQAFAENWSSAFDL